MSTAHPAATGKIDPGTIPLPVTVHPVANIFPRMSAEEFAGLKGDIAEHGVREPLVFWKDQLVDGRNRMAACVELGIDYECHSCELMEETDPVAWVISHNLHRRHLSASQRAMVAAKLRGMFDDAAHERKADGQKRGGENHNASLPAIFPASNRRDSRDEAGAVVNVSGKLVDAATAVLKNGSPELIAKVERGEVAATRAAEVAKNCPKEKQIEKLDRPSKAAIKKMFGGKTQWDDLRARNERARSLFERLLAERRENDHSDRVLNLYDRLETAIHKYRQSVLNLPKVVGGGEDHHADHVAEHAESNRKRDAFYDAARQSAAGGVE